MTNRSATLRRGLPVALVAGAVVAVWLGVAGWRATAADAPAAGEAAPPAYDEAAAVFERRCVVCHACYDAPCQLDLGDWQGVARGATKARVYDSSRPHAVQPTRLFVDAHDVEGWRRLGFFPVLGGGDVAPEKGLIARMLDLGRASHFEADARLPDSIDLDINRTYSCPTDAEFDGYAEKHPQGGMPYAVAPLPYDEVAAVFEWLEAGAPAPAPGGPLASAVALEVARWEAFLNGGSLKQRITARYLYEHWFLADLELADAPGAPFFRIVRSRTAPGEPVDEIATVRPYDDPGVESFSYRLVPVDLPIVHKTHIVYRLDLAKLERLDALFLQSAWTPTRLPSYEVEEASNPFVAFDQIPGRSRYQFLLDDARFFVASFIHGPVCRGQVAVNVIEDQFWVAFLDPDADLSMARPDFLDKAERLLRLPAENESEYTLGSLWLEYNRSQREYMDLLKKVYDAEDPEKRGPRLAAIWDGDGTDPDAFLTVFRNFDNAMVMRGLVGDFPKTAWVMDFPIFERIYYNLVAGFNVFGNVTHQISTRLYMDHLRMQSEDLFLLFLPLDVRNDIRASWYRGARLQVSYYLTNSLRGFDHGTQIAYRTDDPKRELLQMWIDRDPSLVGAPDRLNRCRGGEACWRSGAPPLENAVEDELRRVVSRKGPFVAPMPELFVLRVRGEYKEPDLVYTLVTNRAHSNVAFMFLESLSLEPEDDTLTAIRGQVGSYPNFVFDVPAQELRAFVDALLAVEDEDGVHALAARWGVRRTSPRFWETVDWLHDDLRRQAPEAAGILDFDRYGNF